MSGRLLGPIGHVICGLARRPTHGDAAFDVRSIREDAVVVSSGVIGCRSNLVAVWIGGGSETEWAHRGYGDGWGIPAADGIPRAVFANTLEWGEAWRDEVIGQLRHCVQTGYIVRDVGLSHIPAERFL
jgi:hypothetical protein